MRENKKKNLENKEGLKAVALPLNISECRENGETSISFSPHNRIKKG